MIGLKVIFDERKGVKTHGLERNQRLRRTLHGVRYRQNHEPAKNDQNVKRLQNDFQKKNSQVQQAEKRHQSNPSG